MHWTGTGSRLAAHDDPVDVVERKGIERSDEWLAGKEPDSGRDFDQVVDSGEHTGVFHADPHPDVPGPWEGSRDFPQSSASLGENLEHMLGALRHGLEYLLDEPKRHVLVKEITHGIHEHESRRPPASRQIEQIILQSNGESVGVTSLTHGLEAQRESLGVAELAAGADLRAACDGIPGCIGPLDRRL
jgi:hypothetical protein